MNKAKYDDLMQRIRALPAYPAALYDGLRRLQQELPARAAAGENIDALAEETWALFCSIR